MQSYACDNCGQTDDHPKLHYGAETYHHDCVPARVMADVRTSDPDAVARVEKIAAQAKKIGDAGSFKSTRHDSKGDALREFIQKEHS